MARRSPELIAYLIQGLQARASVLLARAGAYAISCAAACALAALAHRALARAASLRADLMQRAGRVTETIAACEDARALARAASVYAHAADVRGA